MVGFCCCEDLPIDRICESCLAGTVPATLLVTLGPGWSGSSGSSIFDCSSTNRCASINGPFLVDYCGNFAGTCKYRYRFSTTGCELVNVGGLPCCPHELIVTLTVVAPGLIQVAGTIDFVDTPAEGEAIPICTSLASAYIWRGFVAGPFNCSSFTKALTAEGGLRGRCEPPAGSISNPANDMTVSTV